MCLTDRDAMHMSVVYDVILDQDVLVKHLVAGGASIDHLVAHEDGLCRQSRAAVEEIAAMTMLVDGLVVPVVQNWIMSG